MNLEEQILFFFSGLGVFNGFLLSVYLIFVLKPRRVVNLLLGLLLFMLCMRIGKSVFLYFTDSAPKIYLQIGLSACFFIGPMLYLYVFSMLRSIERWTKGMSIHVFLVSGVIIVAGVIYPYETFPKIWNKHMIWWIYLQWIVYVITSGILLLPIFKKALTSGERLEINERWLLVLYLLNVVICLFFNLAYYGISYYIMGPLVFSFLFYGLIYFLFFYKNGKQVLHAKVEKYAKKKIQTASALDQLSRLEEVMKQEKVYKNPSLKLKDLAAKVNISAHQLSQLLNDNLGKSFSQYINEYRIEAACSLLSTHDHFTLEGIGQEVGFQSRSTFYATFKKVKGTTPAKFKEGV